jgi:hypothetical protein
MIHGQKNIKILRIGEPWSRIKEDGRNWLNWPKLCIKSCKKKKKKEEEKKKKEEEEEEFYIIHRKKTVRKPSCCTCTYTMIVFRFFDRPRFCIGAVNW